MNTNRIGKMTGSVLALTLAAGMGVSAPGCGDETVPSGLIDGGAGTGAAGSGAAGSAAAGSGAAGSGVAGASGTAGAGAGPSDGGLAGSGGVDTDGGTPVPTTTVAVTADVVANTTWTADKVYVLGANKKIFVRAPAVLTIEPGTQIQGEKGTALLVMRGAKIMAEGTAAKPIVFTSARPVGQRKSADWGGLILLGKAPINTNAATGGLDAIFEAVTTAEGTYGGSDVADSSGSLKYVRIEFGGEAYLPDKEFNNLTLCGVGSGTTIDFVHVHRGADDGVELFGGTVNLKHILSTQNEDDGFDTDNGWQGKVQFMVIQHLTQKGSDASNGYESDNHGTAASYRQTPRTMPTIYNVTSIGNPAYANGWGALLRRGTGGHYFNHIITGFAKGAVETRDISTKEQLEAGNLFIKNSVFFKNGPADANWPAPQAADDILEQTYFGNATWANMIGVDPQLPATATDLANPTFLPTTPMAGATPVNEAGSTFFDVTATFVGAVGAADWTKGWTSYPQPPAL